MATVTLQRIRPFAEIQAHGIIGPVTGTLYSADALGRVTVSTSDAPFMIAAGWRTTQPGAGDGSTGTSGTAVIDFGAFPGSTYASVTIAAVDAANPNAVVDAWIAPAATADHSIDEHIIDPPQVAGYADGNGNVVIVGVPRPGLNSPIPPDPMPYGKWSVGYAFAA